MDFERIKASGPWVFLKWCRPDREDGLQKRGVLFIPDSTAEEVTGHSEAMVLSVGSGIWDKDRGMMIPPDFKAGDRIIFRTWLKDRVKPQNLNEDYFFLRQEDVLLVRDGE